MSCLMRDVWILEHVHAFIHVLKCGVTQVIEHVLRHGNSRVIVKSFSRVMVVQEEGTGTRKGGKHAQEGKEQKLVQQSRGRIAAGARTDLVEHVPAHWRGAGTK